MAENWRLRRDGVKDTTLHEEELVQEIKYIINMITIIPNILHS
jgi:hypothetical protein